MFAFTFITSLLFLITVLLFEFNRRIRCSNKGKPPGPPCFPVVGSLPFLSINGQKSFRDLALRYGPVFYLKIGSSWTVVLNSFDSVEEALVKQSSKFIGRKNNFFTDFVADNSRGIFYLDGAEKCSYHRKLVLKSLFGSTVRPHMERFVLNEVNLLQEKIFNKCNQLYDIESDMMSSVSNIISMMMFSSRVEDESNKLLMDFIKTSCTSCREKATVINLLYSMPWTRFLPGFGKQMEEMKEGMDIGYAAMDKQITEHLDTFDSSDKRDFIDHYIAENDATNKSYDKRQLIQFLKDIFVAGTETSASTLRWILLMVTKHPEVQKKIHDEIDQKIGRNGKLSRDLNLPYIRACILEVMRLRTTVPLSIPRSATCDAVVNGYHIPKGTEVIPNLWAVHNDPALWKNPEVFDPMRHINERGHFVPSRKIIPFSLGGRNCLGATLAKMEVFLFTVGIFQKFRVSPNSEKDPDLTEIPGFITTPNPYDFVFSLR